MAGSKLQLIMRLAFGGRKAHLFDEDVVEVRVGTEVDMLDFFANVSVLAMVAVAREQRQRRTKQRGVAGGRYLFAWKFQQPDLSRAGVVDVIAECAREVEHGKVLGFCPPLFEQDTNASRDGALGKLQFANVGLGELHGWREHHFHRTIGETARFLDRTELKTGGDHIHEAAPAEAARLDVAQHVTLELAVLDPCFRDCTRRRA